MTDLDIGELAVDLAAVTTPSRLGTLEREVAASVTACLADELSALADAADAHDGAQVFIDTLDVACSLASSWDGAKVARALAVRVHDEIGFATRSGACVAFRDRAEFVAALIVALTDGQARRHWWFDSFDGLALVPASNAVRTVVLDEGDAGIAALARLTAGDARRVVGALRAADAARILDRIALRVDCASPDASVLWENAACGDDPNATLLALVAAERYEPRSAGHSGLALLRSFQSLRTIAPARLATIVESSGNGVRDELRSLGVDIGGLGEIDTAIIAAICREACERPDDHSHGGAQLDAAATLHTPHGGVFLLRVVLERTDWRERWARTLDDFDAVTEDAVAWMIVTRALCDDSTVAADEVVHALLPPGADTLVQSLRSQAAIACAIADESEALLHAFAHRLPGCDEASAEWLRAKLLSFDARVVADAGSIHATVGRPPLDVLLVLAGWKRAQCRLASGRVLTLREAR